MSVNLPVSLAQTGWLPSEPGHACCRCPMPSGEKCRWSHSAPSITKQLPSSTAATVQGATVSQLGRECMARLVSPLASIAVALVGAWWSSISQMPAKDSRESLFAR